MTSFTEKTSAIKNGDRRLVRKIDVWTKKENPPSQKFSKKQLKIIHLTVSKVFKTNWTKKFWKWPKSINLTQRTMQIGGPKVGHCKKNNQQTKKLNSSLGKASYYCSSKLHRVSKDLQLGDGGRRPWICVPQGRQVWKKILIVDVLSRRGTLPLIKVLQNVKINTKYFIDCVLKPILEKKVPNSTHVRRSNT